MSEQVTVEVGQVWRSRAGVLFWVMSVTDDGWVVVREAGREDSAISLRMPFETLTEFYELVNPVEDGETDG